MATGLRAGRDFPPDFEYPDVCQEFIPVDPGGTWYINVETSDLESVYHVIRQALSFARNPPEQQTEHPTTHRRVAAPTDVKVRWTLARDVRAREYVISFNYAWPVSISLSDQGELAGYAAPAISISRTRFESDDINPRRYIVHVRWLPYPALPIAKSKCFYFYPEPAIHLMDPISGIGREDQHAHGKPSRAGRSANQSRSAGGLLRSLGGMIGFGGGGTDNNVDHMNVDEDEKNRGEPASKKRKIEQE